MAKRFLLLVLISCNLANTYAGVLPGEVEITGNVVKRGLNPFDYCCVNWEMGSGLNTFREIFATPDHRIELIRFLRDDVSIRCFRYPGGGLVRNFFFGVPSSKWFADSKTSGRPDSWIEVEEFFKFLADGDFRTFLQVNTFRWFDKENGRIKPIVISEQGKPDRIDPAGLKQASDAVEQLARWLKKNDYQRLIRFWEIGNEEYGQSTYPAIAASLIRRIKKVLPDAPVIVTTQFGLWKGSDRNKWSEYVLRELAKEGIKDQIVGVTSHVYAFAKRVPGGGLTRSTAYQEYAANVSFIANDPYIHPWGDFVQRNGKRVSVVDFHAHTVDACGYKNTPIYITEYKNGGMHEMYNKALANGIGNTLLLASFVAAPRVGGATHHSIIHGSHVTRGSKNRRPRPFNVWGYNVIHYQADDDLEPRFVSTPAAEGFNLIWKLARGDVLATKSSTKFLYAVATRDTDTLRLLVVNRAAKPEYPNDVSPNKWGWGAATELAKASEKGDRFHATIVLPKNFLPAPRTKIHALGESERLADYSADPHTYNVHEIKVKSAVAAVTGPKFQYTFAPHSVVLFEFTARRATDP